MRRLSGLIVAGALLMVAPTQSAFAQAAQKTTFDGQMAIWSFGIKPDQTAAYEQVLGKLKEALAKSARPEAKQMAAGWKVMKGVVNPQTGNVIYTHVLDPVVKDADYTIMSIIYETFTDPNDQKTVYELYRGAFGAALGANVGTVVADFSTP